MVFTIFPSYLKETSDDWPQNFSLECHCYMYITRKKMQDLFLLFIASNPTFYVHWSWLYKKISGWVKEEVPTFHVDVLFTKDIEGGKGEEGRKYKEISVPLRFRTNQLFT